MPCFLEQFVCGEFLRENSDEQNVTEIHSVITSPSIKGIHVIHINWASLLKLLEEHCRIWVVSVIRSKQSSITGCGRKQTNIRFMRHVWSVSAQLLHISLAFRCVLNFTFHNLLQILNIKWEVFPSHFPSYYIHFKDQANIHFKDTEGDWTWCQINFLKKKWKVDLNP